MVAYEQLAIKHEIKKRLDFLKFKLNLTQSELIELLLENYDKNVRGEINENYKRFI